MNDWKKISIPEDMRSLRRDRRGYPIPYTVFVNGQNQPDFRVTDSDKVDRCFNKKLCSICGKPLLLDMWVLGGIRVMLSEIGRILEPALHKECGIYSLKVCQYLGNPKVMKVNPNEKVEGHMLLGKPPVWVLGKTAGYRTAISNGIIQLLPFRPFIKKEFWKDGIKISEKEAMKFYNA